ncbi:P-loop containing nucleoside triphosphate hydrolase protein [Auriscalpium vulgare]|uniref:P-loop containing nucleoside triphosphate hydrolase protein n=1 Tax=Auriscalpium vulgare TaxID=40419 RepID=A0ACB8RVK7_9AGAM|nr:P-loop containing nucleoside triphosphate hydrolase protein [Auriscalpium vulgare]
MAGLVLQLVSLVSPILSLLNGSDGGAAAALNATVSNATMTGASSAPLGTPFNLTSLIAWINSFSALRDYFKLIILGGAFETLRRFYSFSYVSLVDRFYISASFESEDDTFDWMMFWLSSLPQWRKFRDFTVSTNDLGLESDAIELEEDDEDSTTRSRTRPVRYLPSYAANYTMWYKRRWMRITRTKEESRWHSDKSTLTVTILSRDRSVLDALILEARKKWLSARADKIDIYAMDGSDWRFVSSRPKRPINSIILDAGVKELILDDARDFLKSKTWYSERGFPFRRGYLLYGAPGSGKTSIIHSLAGELGLDIYIISLSKMGLDDTTLNSLICALPPQCIAIMEDIDAAFTRGITRSTVGTELDDPHREKQANGQDDNPESQGQQGHAQEHRPGGDVGSSRITLSGLLNALDGVSAQEGRLLFATTNRYSVLDAALTRPGRMDLHVEFRLASRYQAREMFKRFFRFFVPGPASADAAGAAEQQDDDGAEEEGIDSGYGTPTKEKPAHADLIDLSAAADDSAAPAALPTPSTSALASDAAPTFNGTSHSSRAPTLSKKQILRLAERFAASIPEREFSMASMQGYLMAYKVRPVQAAEDIEQWVKEQREERERKEKYKRTGFVKEEVKDSASVPAAGSSES